MKPVNEQFWECLEQLVEHAEIVVERPKGSVHPRFPDTIYPLDYGYLDQTKSSDGSGVDVWIGSEPERELKGIMISVDLFKRDVEVKLALGCSPAEIEQIHAFMNSGAMKVEFIHRKHGTFTDLIRSRRSVREFLSDPIPREMLEAILEAATWAPSAHNRQPWRFVVLTGADYKRKLASEMGAKFYEDLLAGGLSEEEIQRVVSRSRRRIESAPVVVLLCLDATLGDPYPDESRQQAEYLMGVQSVALAGGTLLLAAHAAGLGGVWVCAPLFAPEIVRTALALPEHWEPVGLILLGTPARIPAPRPRAPVSEVALFL
jgi:F420 biosynthesis protein FbiB-like protein